jgi:hypothetical protein
MKACRVRRNSFDADSMGLSFIWVLLMGTSPATRCGMAEE